MSGQALTANGSSNEGSVTSEAVPVGSELADGSTNPVVTSDASLPGQTDTLDAPTSALPESITSVSSQDISAPETNTNSTFAAPSSPTVSETTPDEVVSPDASITPPSVGATPHIRLRLRCFARLSLIHLRTHARDIRIGQPRLAALVINKATHFRRIVSHQRQKL